MISRLRGRLLEKNPPILLVDVQGVGYEVFVPMTTFYLLPDIGEEVVLHTHFVVREDAQQLYGFGDTRDRELFRTLLKVSGVGPKLALAILSGMETADLLRCVRDDNVKALSQIPGIGKKTAERLVIELRDRLVKWTEESVASGKAAAASRPADKVAEAESALVALGYKPAEATKLVSAATQAQPDASSEVLIRLALKSAWQG